MARVKCQPIGLVDPTRIIIGGKVRMVSIVDPDSVELEAWCEVAQVLPVGYTRVQKRDENDVPMTDKNTGAGIYEYQVRCAVWAYERAATMFRRIMDTGNQQLEKAA